MAFSTKQDEADRMRQPNATDFFPQLDEKKIKYVLILREKFWKVIAPWLHIHLSYPGKWVLKVLILFQNLESLFDQRGWWGV